MEWKGKKFRWMGELTELKSRVPERGGAAAHDADERSCPTW